MTSGLLGLHVRAATMQFGGLTALSSFSIAVVPGDLQGLIGPNGAGKTTAFNVMTGVYAPTSGEVLIDGIASHGRAPHQVCRMGVARTFQNIRLFKELTAFDNVRIGTMPPDRPASSPLSRLAIDGQRRSGHHRQAQLMDAAGNYVDWWRAWLRTPGFLRDEAAISASADELLSLMGLAHRRDELAKNLPYGEQRRLEIARALATKPKVLLLDEPAAGMNTREKAELMTLIRQLRDQLQVGILLIEHDMKLVMGVCERLTVLDHGEVIAAGTPTEVKSNPEVIEAYLGVAATELQA